ncbi:hypothetical protein C7974DRAFT_453128 [Boeremia exigua]|uniref:uncharacterized protein n=1 Tax=Boeremia exigua TaxID=749465 RepID=UPI001E8DBA92|nr:uncharacterized protein C7974DRAFT_453128 [Boeremia exigua]KAH6633678.1 hypothetical protein C7974DRAFT_453128 [Boeremia exigua]
MAMNDDVEAKRLGEKLLLDVQVEGLSSILSSLRELDAEGNASTTKTPFGIPELDALTSSSSPAILELISPPSTHHPSGAGKTSLLYLIIAHAILPPSFPSIPHLNGHDAAIILLDPLHHFSVPRLATTILSLLTSHLPAPVDPDTKSALTTLTARCLAHVHIFHPTSWPSLLATLRALPTYLFTAPHPSAHRRIHSLLLDDADAFTASLRAAPAMSSTTGPLTAASRALTAEVARLAALLSCNAVLTASAAAPSGFRALVPVAWPPGQEVVRVAVRRVGVPRFAAGMGVQAAEAERGQRWDVVRRGRFECWRVGGEGRGDGFVFRVGREGGGG